MIYRAYVLDENSENQYQKDGGDVSEFESYGVMHSVVSNKDMQTVAWINGRVECMLSVECAEDTLHKIIWSIYTTEDYI